MKKLLQINPVLRLNTSTGRIMQEIGELAMRHGWQNYMAYSKGRDGLKACSSQLIPVGNKWSVMWHGLETRLFDRHGLASKQATRRFIRQIESIRPDIIHIHNIHGYGRFMTVGYILDIVIITRMHIVTGGKQVAIIVHSGRSFLLAGW